MTGWFGADWGAPCCEDDDHVKTPVGEACFSCKVPIVEGDQGITMPLIGFDERTVTTAVYHLDCYLKKVLPHTFDCAHCRGRDSREGHAETCAYRVSGANCSCYPAWAPMGVT